MNTALDSTSAGFRREVFLVQSAGSRFEDVLVHSRRTKLVLAAAQALVKAGKQSFSPADIGEALRERSEPMSAWEVRGELSTLEAAGEVVIDAATARWSLAREPA